MEVKWGPVKGRFSHESQLKNLASMHKKKLARTLEPCPLPSKWGNHLKNFDASGFSWQGEDSGAKGVLLHCPQCGTASILQFFKEGAVPSRVLESFQDHVDGGMVPWSVFDIQALIPEQFKLVSHAFLAGKFTLVFEGDSMKLHLYRYSPASVLLANGGLQAFAGSVFPDLPVKSDLTSHLGHQAVEYAKDPGTGLKKILGRISPKGTWSRFRLWHVKKENRIMAVTLEGKKPDLQLFEQICTHYESI